MKTYVEILEQTNQFILNNPTLARQRKTLGSNGKLSDFDEPKRFIGKSIQDAGMNFLESIHDEIFQSKPRWEQEKIQRELLEGESEEETVNDESDYDKTREISQLTTVPVATKTNQQKPELTKEYVISIGRPDLACW